MAEMISYCPECGTTNVVESSPYMRMDSGKRVTCKKCKTFFWAKMTNEDIKALCKDSSDSPEVTGDEDYVLEGVIFHKN